MKQVTTTVLATLALGWFTASAGESLFTTPFIEVSPHGIDLGAVAWKRTVTTNFVVENWGGGNLAGKATVKPPFKILSGASYQLRPGDAQIVTISYSPTGAALDTNVVKFTGGGGALVPITGKLAGTIPGKEK